MTRIVVLSSVKMTKKPKILLDMAQAFSELNPHSPPEKNVQNNAHS